MDGRYAELERFSAMVQESLTAADAGDMVIKRVGADNSGWDDAVIIACGKVEARILAPLGIIPSRREIDDQVLVLVPVLRKASASRAARDQALQDTVARFYCEAT